MSTTFPSHYARINDRFGPAYIAPPSEPVITETPGTLFEDTFEGFVGSSIANRAIGTVTWSTPAGNAKIDKAGVATTTASLRAVMDAGVTDGEVSVVFGLTNYNTGLLLRWTDTKNYLRFILVEGGWQLGSMVNGGYRLLASGTSSAARCSTVTLGAALKGEDITLLIDGEVVTTHSTSYNLAGTRFGLYAQNGGDRSFESFSFQCPSTVVIVDAPDTTPDTRPLHYVGGSFRFPADYKNIPLRCDPYNLGTPNQDNGDYWSDSGQIAFVSADPAKPGLAAIRVFAYYDGTFATAPLPDVYRGTTNPDPSTRNADYIAANGGVAPNEVITQVRSVDTTGNDAFVLWANGLITVATTQTGHGSAIWPWLKLDPTKEVMDMAVTSMNELLIVAVRDTVRNVGQLAVIMVESRGIPFHTFREMGMPNQASVTALKLLGYIDLPVASSLKVAAASNGHWNGVSSTMVRVTNEDGTGQNVGLSLGQMSLGIAGKLTLPNKEGVKVPINSETIRGNLKDGSWLGVVADSGYATVVSRDENSVVVVDLSPVFRYIREGWLATATSYEETYAARAAGTWPETFEENLAIVPVINSTHVIEKPASVICGHSLDRWSGDRYKFHVGTESGDLVVYDASALMARLSWERKSSAIKLIARHFVGENVCAMAFSRRDEGSSTGIFDKEGQKGDGKNSVIWAVCRKARKLVCLVTFGAKLGIIRTFEDKRLVDPVNVTVAERGYIVLVADFAHGGENGKVIGLRVGSLTDKRATPDIVYPVGRIEGGPEYDFEISGFLPLKSPHSVSSANVN